MKKICRECGKSFETIGNQHNMAYCSFECRKTAEHKRIAEAYEKKKLQRQEASEAKESKPKVVKRKHKKLTIGEISVLARKAGMTYGKYVAQNKL